MVKIGWTGNRTKITIDATDMGNIVMDSNIGVANSSLVKTALNASGTAPIYACRAWVNFNGTGTVAIRASGNVSSITDNGVGYYTVNFTTAMQDSNYVLTGSANFDGSTEDIFLAGAGTPAVNNVTIVNSVGNWYYDSLYVNVAIIR